MIIIIIIIIIIITTTTIYDMRPYISIYGKERRKKLPEKRKGRDGDIKRADIIISHVYISYQGKLKRNRRRS